MATRKATSTGPMWPFDDDQQRERMSRALGRHGTVAPAGPFGLSMATERPWEADRDWVARSGRAPRWTTDPGWATDERWVAHSAAAMPRPWQRAVHGAPGANRLVALGYHPDLRDRRDYPYRELIAGPSRAAGPASAQRLQMASQLGQLALTGSLPSRVNSIPWCPPVEDQGPLGSCTAQAVVSLVEYMQRRSGNEHVDGSRLFVYKVARRLQGWTGDTGCYLRTTIKAVAAFGVPPEAYWPYDIDRFEDEPSAFLYSFASNYLAIGYARLDPPGLPAGQVLSDVKQALASGLGVVFGFPVYSSAGTDGEFPMPSDTDKLLGGHAVMAVGYDDNHSGGALLIRNSWGSTWGQAGYGYLPYEYVESGLAQDFWTITKAEWLNLAAFG